jgi:uncharacterized protein
VDKTPEVVFDTQIYLRAIINQKSACGRLLFNMQDDYTLYTTAKINVEIMDVLTRSSIRDKFPQITDAHVQLVQDALDLANFIQVKPEDIDPICRDPKDDIFLACAKIAGADYLVSEDKDLLILEKHHKTKIVGVATFLSTLESRKVTLSETEKSSSDDDPKTND